jgi:hypothetical protein
MARGLRVVAVVLLILAAERPTAAVQATVARPESALRLDVEVVRHRRCDNDLSTTDDRIDARLVFTNVSSNPIAVTRQQRGVVYEIRLDATRGVEQGKPLPHTGVMYDPLWGNGPPLLWDAARPELDKLTVLLPGDALALDTTLSLRVARSDGGSEVTGLRRRPYAMSLTSHLRVSTDESEVRPSSGFRSITFLSRPIPLDLSVSLPLEFCEASDRSSR